MSLCQSIKCLPILNVNPYLKLFNKNNKKLLHYRNCKCFVFYSKMPLGIIIEILICPKLKFWNLLERIENNNKNNK